VSQRYLRWTLGWTSLFFALIFTPGSVWSWGWMCHRWVNEQAFGYLPAEMTGFGRWARVVVAHSSDADHRKTMDPLESPRHWIDIDNFPEFYQGRLSHDLDSLKARHGHRMDVYGNGVVPWAIAGVTETMAVAMAAADWGEAILLAADLGHYVADCHQPLHTTKNYDGQLSGNEGIHLRYEIDMIRRNLDQLRVNCAEVTYVENPLEYIFATIEGTWLYVDSILAADRQARSEDPAYGDDYYRILWQRTNQFTTKQLSRATQVLANLWYTAWVNAGRPAFPCSTAIASIADVQANPQKHHLVAVEGVVTIGSGVLDREHTRVYIQDDSERGILVFDHDPIEDLLRGDLLRVEGSVQEYHGVTELSGPSVTLLERNCPCPQPQVLSTGRANDDRWDDTLIKVRGVVVFTLQEENWTRLHMNDGSGAIVVLVPENLGINLDTVDVDDILTVSGVGTFLADEGSYAILAGYSDQVVLEEAERDAR